MRIALQGARKSRYLVGRLREFRRIDPDGIDRGADGERLAKAVQHRAAVGRHLGDSRIAHVALLGQEFLVEHLQLQCAAQQRQCECRQQADQQPRAQAKLSSIELSAGLAPLHGVTIRTSSGVGSVIRSFLLATRSTKP